MKIVILEPQDYEDEQIIFKCRSMTPELLRIIAKRIAAFKILAVTVNENIYI